MSSTLTSSCVFDVVGDQEEKKSNGKVQEIEDSLTNQVFDVKNKVEKNEQLDIDQLIASSSEWTDRSLSKSEFEFVVNQLKQLKKSKIQSEKKLISFVDDNTEQFCEFTYDDIILDLSKEDLTEYVVYPLNPKYVEYFVKYKEQEASNWGVDEIDFSKDMIQWNSNDYTKESMQWVEGMLNKREKAYLINIFVFFLFSDPLIAKNQGSDFVAEEKNLYYQMALRIQAAMEDRHAETYSKIVQMFVGNQEKVKEILRNQEKMSSVRKKIAWIKEMTNAEKYDFIVRILAVAIIEGLFFISSFAAIDYFGKDDRMPGLAQSNRLIRNDEYTHRCLGILAWKEKMGDKIHAPQTKEKVLKMVKKITECECEFVRESLITEIVDEKTGEKQILDGFPGLNSELMCQHVKYVADQILIDTIGESYYNCENPLEFTHKGEYTKSNFFEQHETSYQTGGVLKFAKKNIEEVEKLSKKENGSNHTLKNSKNTFDDDKENLPGDVETTTSNPVKKVNPYSLEINTEFSDEEESED